MKIRNLPIILVPLTALVIFFSSRLAPRSLPASSPDPELTINLPDASVTYKLRDLPVDNQNIIIPSSDNSVPQFNYDNTSGTVSLVSSPMDYSINIQDLQPYLSFSSPLSQSVTPSYTEVSRYAPRVIAYNQRLNNVYRSPLTISLKDGSKTTDLSLPPSLIRQVIRPISLDLSIPLSLDEPVLLSYIISHLTPKQKDYFNLNSTTTNVRLAIKSRFALGSTPVVLGVDDGSTSHGELANHYLEIDLSQQKMYFFMGGKLYKEYQISSGLDYETPVGEYHILNKAPLAFSGIYNAWMPYWMAFYYDNQVGAYLGLHEIAYQLSVTGDRLSSSRSIGDKLTGGCIALSPKDSKEVYNLADIGMLVRIVP